jgi:hypothetical protein
VNARGEEAMQDGGNVTAVGVLELNGNEGDVENLAYVKKGADDVKTEASRRGRGIVGTMVGLLPGGLRGPLQFREFSTRDIVASNVPMPIPGELCGVPFEMMFMVAPAIGTSISFTFTSYKDYLYLASNVDVGVISQPPRLDKCIEEILRGIFGAGVQILREGTMIEGDAVRS